ncbi:MAG: glycosyltransferase family 2 protein [bacterium]
MKIIQNLVSVIIPSYNTESYICESIESVLNQSYTKIEILIIDDGSTDNTELILKDYIKNNQIKYFKKQNGGPASARNLGIKKSTGEYIAFIDADDMWEKNKIERQLQIIKETQSDLVYTSRYLINSNNTQRTFDDFHFQESLCGLIDNNYIINSSVLLGKEVVSKYLFDEYTESFAVEDYKLWLKLKSLNYKFTFINEPLTLYRIHSKQISHTALKNLIKLYWNIFLYGLEGTKSFNYRALGLYKYFRLTMYRLKLTISK